MKHDQCIQPHIKCDITALKVPERLTSTSDACAEPLTHHLEKVGLLIAAMVVPNADKCFPLAHSS